MATTAINAYRGEEVAAKLEKLADGLDKQIEQKRAPMSQAFTPKRNREYQSRMIDGNRLERVQRALRTLAKAWRSDGIPNSLRDVKTKAKLEKMLSKRTDHRSYYEVYETADYYDQSERAKLLRRMMDYDAGESGRAADHERRQKTELQAKIDRLRLCDIPGFFPTPEPVIRRMLEILDRESIVISGLDVLEPSAGIGSIADICRQAGAYVECIERNHSCCEILRAKGYPTICDDFLAQEPYPEANTACTVPARTLGEPETFTDRLFDAVLMNPPFERLQDTEHVQHAWRFLKKGGILVAIMSPSAFGSSTKACAFVDWHERHGLNSEDLPAKSFDSIEAFRRTGVSAKIVWGIKA